MTGDPLAYEFTVDIPTELLFAGWTPPGYFVRFLQHSSPPHSSPPLSELDFSARKYINTFVLVSKVLLPLDIVPDDRIFSNGRRKELSPKIIRANF